MAHGAVITARFALIFQLVIIVRALDSQNVNNKVEELVPGFANEPHADIDDSSVHFKFRGREWHPESFGYTNCSTPTPNLKHESNIFGCRILHDVCVDQGVIIYQDSRFHPWTSENRLPQFNITEILWNTPSLLGIGDKWKIGKNRYQMPLLRPWHHMEESDDVRRPVFSNCTTPLLFFHHFPFNVAEVYRFAVNNIYFMQQRLRFFDDHITLVPGSPPTSAVPSFTRFWLQPFSHYTVTSLGNLSQRWPAGTAPPPSTSTGEGHAVRCFSRFIMCKITLKKPTGAFYAAGQYVAEYYMKQAIPREANFTARLSMEVPLADLHDDAVLKVVFAVRSKSHKDIGRVLVNEDELIDQCNRPEMTFPNGTSIFRRVRCFRHIFGVDNLYDIWLVRQSDVVVGVHGSALTNAMFMRRGSALIELRPYGFSGRESWPNIYMKSQTRGMDVFWFGIDVMNGSLSSAGDFERDMQPIYTRARGCLARDRNLEVPWPALEHQLLNVAVVSRSIWRYKVLRYSHSYYITHDVQPLELPGKDKRVPEVLQSWFTDPDESRRQAAAIPLTPEGGRAAQAKEEEVLARWAAEQEAARPVEEEAEEPDREQQGQEEGHGQQQQQQEQPQEGLQTQEGHPHVMDVAEETQEMRKQEKWRAGLRHHRNRAAGSLAGRLPHSRERAVQLRQKAGTGA